MKFLFIDMSYKLFVHKIKKFLRDKFPLIYPFVYRNYLYITDSKIEKNRIKTYSQFVKSGFYEFKLNEICFDIMLDPENGGVDMEIFADKKYEANVLSFLNKNLKKEDTFIDIGANIGQHSLHCSFICNHVYSFEPVKKLYDQFNESIFKNNILNISSYNYGIGDIKCEVPIFSNISSMAASSIVASNNKNFIQNVKILRLDDVYGEIGIDRADVLKIDVEGYELNVLLGARNFIEKFKPKILLEFSPYFYNKFDKTISKRIIDLLIESGYIIYDLGENNDEKTKVNNFEELKNKSQTNLFCEHPLL